MASEGLHESADLLSAETIDRHRAITSIMEELAAVDWYDQRVNATGSPDLAEVPAFAKGTDAISTILAKLTKRGATTSAAPRSRDWQRSSARP